MNEPEQSIGLNGVAEIPPQIHVSLRPRHRDVVQEAFCMRGEAESFPLPKRKA